MSLPENLQDSSETSPMVDSNIPKWPFILCDGILVIASIAIAFANGGPLELAEFCCVILGIGLGSLIAVAPFIIDHLLNQKTRNMLMLFQQDESWKLQLEAALIQQKELHAKRIQELKIDLEDLTQRLEQKTVVTIPVETEPPTEIVSQPELAETTPLTDLEKEVIATSTTNDEPVLPKPVYKPKTPLLSKAIAQAQKNKPSKTVQRMLKSMTQPKTSHS